MLVSVAGFGSLLFCRCEFIRTNVLNLYFFFLNIYLVLFVRHCGSRTALQKVPGKYLEKEKLDTKHEFKTQPTNKHQKQAPHKDARPS